MAIVGATNPTAAGLAIARLDRMRDDAAGGRVDYRLDLAHPTPPALNPKCE